MANKEKITKLRDLYEKTGSDWSLSAHWSLTEPVIAVARFEADDEDLPLFRCHCENIDDAIDAVVKEAYKHYFLE